jgi:hypothetical protein
MSCARRRRDEGGQVFPDRARGHTLMPFWLLFVIFLFWRALEAYCREERDKRQ